MQLKTALFSPIFISIIMILTLTGTIAGYFAIDILNKEFVGRINIISDTFVDGVRESILLGAPSEVVRKCQALVDNEYITSVMIKNFRSNVICQEGKNNPSSEKIMSEIYFDENRSLVAANISIDFDNTFLESTLYAIGGATILGLLAVLLFLFVVINSILKRPISTISDISSLLAAGNFNEIKKYTSVEEIGNVTEIANLKNGLSRFLNEILRYQEQLKDHAKNTAISQTTQMLAHDVRKPFSMVRVLLSRLRKLEDSSDTRSIVETFVPEVNRALVSVEGMINDVMEIGSDRNTVKIEPTPVVDIIKRSIFEVFSFDKNAEVTLKYDFKHSYKLFADELKLARVFSNILINANQAMKGRGKIWFVSEDYEEEGVKFVKVGIRNSNSIVLKQDLDRLFHTFYTKNKKGGTGLGLAIAKKIIEDYNGKIWCESDEEIGVMFYFILPASSDLEQFSTVDMPTDSKEIFSSFNSGKYTTPHEIESRIAIEEDSSLEHIGIKSEGYLIVLDDTSIMLAGWELIAPSTKQVHFTCPEALLSRIAVDMDFLEKSLCIITDNDFGVNSNIKGVDLARKITGLGYKKPIYLFSDGFFTGDETDQIFRKKLPKDTRKAWKVIKDDLNL